MDLSKIENALFRSLPSVRDFIRTEQKKVSLSDIQTKDSRQDLVSYVDKQAERMILERCTEILPDAGFISEEFNPTYQEGLNWIIDPLDGTTNYLYGMPNCCMSIALARDEEIVLGQVWEIGAAAIYHSIKNGKSYFNDRKLTVNQSVGFANALFGTGFSVSDHAGLSEDINLLKKLIQNSRGVRRFGSAALDLCYVAEGRLDAFYERNLHAWDIAAGILIVNNAGGDIRDFHGGTNYLFGGEIAAGSAELLEEFLSFRKSI